MDIIEQVLAENPRRERMCIMHVGEDDFLVPVRHRVEFIVSRAYAFMHESEHLLPAWAKRVAGIVTFDSYEVIE